MVATAPVGDDTPATAPRAQRLPELVLVALTHQRATIDIRERVAALADPFADVRRVLGDVPGCPASEFVVLRTCNRFEIYAVTTDVVGTVEVLTRLVGDTLGGLPVSSMLVVRGQDVARHLLRVAAGLESMVLGECHIVHQVRAAFAAARQSASSGAVLSQLFRCALQTGKRVRSETVLGRIDRSIATVAVDEIRARVVPMAGSRVLVLGAGRMAKDVISSLESDPDIHLAVANRTPVHCGGGITKGFDWDRLDEAAAWADVIVAATAAPHVVLGAAVLERAAAARQHAPQLIIDVGVPRNVDPGAGGLAHVQLVHLDALGDGGADTEGGAVAAAEAIVDEGLAQFVRWQRHRLAAASVVALRARAAAIVDVEVERALRRLRHAPHEAPAVVESVARRVASKLLHDASLGSMSPPASN